MNAYSQRTVALLLLCEFVLLATATYFIIPFFAPAVSSGATQTADDGNMLVGAAVGLVVCAVRRAAATRHPLWLVASYCVVAINMVALPAILVVGLRLPASLGMPPLLMAFWVSLTAAIFLITRQLNLIEPKSVGAIIFGGGIGLAGFALFATQIGVVAQGYTSIVPVRSQTGTVDLPMAPPAELVVRFDDGYAQTAYLERGVLNITRPIYYHYVDFTFISKDLPEVERYSGRSASDSLSTYKQAMQCLLTFGLAKPIDSLTSVTLPP